MNWPGTIGSILEPNHSDASCANVVLRAPIIWHYIWNVIYPKTNEYKPRDMNMFRELVFFHICDIITEIKSEQERSKCCYYIDGFFGSSDLCNWVLKCNSVISVICKWSWWDLWGGNYAKTLCTHHSAWPKWYLRSAIIHNIREQSSFLIWIIL